MRPQKLLEFAEHPRSGSQELAATLFPACEA